TTTPITGANGSFTTVSPTTNTSYWVRVTGQCAPTADSPAVTVTVTCSPIASGPTAQPSTINAGGSSTLFFTTNGSGPFTIQWYTGTSGNTANPIPNATGPSITVTPAQTITTYWVHVSNSCNTVGVNSTTGVVTLSASCPSPTITTQPAGVTAGIGTTATLH